MSPNDRILYKFEISHYAEKVRWALDWKGLSYRSREVLMGPGQLLLKARTGSRQVPVLIDDGQIVPDSTRILEHLERAYPEPPLFPAEPEALARTRALEDWADETLGKGIRAYLMSTWRSDERIPALMKLGGGANALLHRLVGGGYTGYDDLDAARADFPRQIARIAGELGGGSYLVADRFTAADLTACSLLAPLYCPAGCPLPYGFARRKPAIADDPELRRVFEWMDFIYAEHRGASDGAPS